MANTASVGSLGFSFKINTEGFSTAMKQLEKSLNKFAKNVGEVGASTASIAAPLAIATTGFLAFEKSQTDAIKGAQDAADAVGMSAAAYMQLNAVFSDLGGGSEAFKAGVGKLNLLMGEAAQGSEEAQKKLDQFGILPTDSTEQAIAKVADKIAAAGSSGERAALAVDAFGKSGKDLVPILAQGAKGLSQMRADAVSTGQALSNGDVATAISLWGQFDSIGDKIEGSLQKLAVAAAPVAELMLQIGDNAIESFASAMPEIEAFFSGMTTLFTNTGEHFKNGFLRIASYLVDALMVIPRLLAGAITTIFDGISVALSEIVGVFSKDLKAGILNATKDLHQGAKDLLFQGNGVDVGGAVFGKMIAASDEKLRAGESANQAARESRKSAAEAAAKEKEAQRAKIAKEQAEKKAADIAAAAAQKQKNEAEAMAMKIKLFGQDLLGKAKGFFSPDIEPQFDAEPEKKQASEARFADLVTRGSQDAFRALQGTKQDEQVSVLKSIDKTLKDSAKKTATQGLALATGEI